MINAVRHIPGVDIPIDDDKLTPPDNSKKPYINERLKLLILSGVRIADKHPTIVEKKTMYPQIEIIPLDELVTEAVNMFGSVLNNFEL